jgi:hypothetical protein
MMIVGVEATAFARHSRPLRRVRIPQGAFRRFCFEGVKIRIVAIESGTIGADDFIIAPHIEEDMRVVEGRKRADAHESLSADLDDRHAQIIVEMGNPVFCHDYILASVNVVNGQGP